MIKNYKQFVSQYDFCKSQLCVQCKDIFNIIY